MRLILSYLRTLYSSAPLCPLFLCPPLSVSFCSCIVSLPFSPPLVGSSFSFLPQIAMLHPEVVTSCNVDLENLISDSNRSIATLAITTLLKVMDSIPFL